MSHSREFAIIVAGGMGTRMNTDVPKQFIELNGLPIIMHTINAFRQYSSDITIILVLPAAKVEVWDQLCKKYKFSVPVKLQEGGATRYQSVKNGLQKIDGDGLVAIHDGARPLVSKETIATSFKLAKTKGSGVASIPINDSIRKISGSHSVAVNRSDFRIMQTPQTFKVSDIVKAYQSPYDETITDDAGMAEKWGINITLFDGDRNNIKITTKVDLAMAEAIIKEQSKG